MVIMKDATLLEILINNNAKNRKSSTSQTNERCDSYLWRHHIGTRLLLEGFLPVMVVMIGITVCLKPFLGVEGTSLSDSADGSLFCYY
jgi:hypothetical protein